MLFENFIHLKIWLFIVWCQSNIFSELKLEALKSEVLLDDIGHSICCFCSSLKIFSNQFHRYCLTPINNFLKHEFRSFQKANSAHFVSRAFGEEALKVGDFESSKV